jgi:type II secretory pathway pseudopilin PulG
LQILHIIEIIKVLLGSGSFLRYDTLVKIFGGLLMRHYNYLNSKLSFSITELLVVIIVISLIAVFGIPNYTKMVNRAREKDAQFNLEMIREAVRLYSVRNAAYPPVLANVTAINSTLNINVMEQEGNTYDCLVANIYTCRATNTAGWQLSFRLNLNDGDVFCSIATCPSL